MKIIATLLNYFNSTPVGAATTTQAYTHTRLFNIPDLQGCTNISGVCIVDTTMYCIKTLDATEVRTVLYKIPNYASANDSSPKTSMLITTDGSNTLSKAVDMGHANGMAYHNGKLYICTSKANTGNNIQVYEIDPSKAEVTRKFKADEKISAITYFRENRDGEPTFIVFIPNDDKNAPYDFAVARIQADTKFDLYNRFKTDNASIHRTSDEVNNGTKYHYRQDIYYDSSTELLYHIVCARNTNQNLVLNKILTTDLSGTVAANKQYATTKVLQANSVKATTTKYELESLWVANKTIYASANYENNTNTAVDSIFRIYPKCL